MYITDLQEVGLTDELAIAELIGLSSVALDKPVQYSKVVIGNIAVGGTISKVSEFAIVLQVCVDASAKGAIILAVCIMNLHTVSTDLLVKVQPIFYSDMVEAVIKN